MQYKEDTIIKRTESIEGQCKYVDLNLITTRFLEYTALINQ